MSRDGGGLSLLLNGLSGSEMPCSPSSVASISPISQLRRGNYKTPTFIIHSRRDEVAPFAAAERFVDKLKSVGVRCGFLALNGVSHLHDLHLKPHMKDWEEQVLPGYQFLSESV